MNPNIPADWYRHFFHGVALDLWRNATPPEMTRNETDFVERVLKITHAARLLDVPCGNGRLALELAGRGHQLTGIDIAEENIAEARAGAVKRNFNIDWHQGDMRNLPWEKAFDGVFCCGNSFGYLDDAGNRDFVHAVARVLRPGGRFLIDYGCAAESILSPFVERRWYQIGDIHLLVFNRHNITLSRLETEFTFIRQGQVETRSGTQRIYTYRELVLLLQAAGFTGIEGYQGWDLQPYRLGSQRLLLTAVRQ
jgi:SAM-dependent methyltransferase